VAVFLAGQHREAHRLLGAHPEANGGGTRFTVWAPHARGVAVVGDFNDWDPHRHPLERLGDSGLWQAVAAGVGPGARYRVAVYPRARGAGTGEPLARPDPFARQFYAPGSNTAVVTGESDYPWADAEWATARVRRDWLREPIAIYEVDLESWARDERGEALSYRELAAPVAQHALGLGFTHIELLSLTEHDPLAPGRYAAGGLFAPTARFGDADGFRAFVDHCHRTGVGVIVDWPAAQLAASPSGLAGFDGEPLYEQALEEDPPTPLRTFAYGAGGVRSFLLSSALYWLRELHVDGLRLPCMSSMLYLDYARTEGDWIPNKYGGNENLDAIAFLRALSEVVSAEAPGTLLIAEESSAWPQVTRPPWVGGLGFSLRWNVGWVRDTLEYLAQDPVYRHYHHDLLTFSPMYAFQDSYVLALSHEEVGPGRGALLDRMPGDPWQRRANVRLLYTYLWTHPGKKLLFLGGETGFSQPWAPADPLDPAPAARPELAGIAALVRDLNRLYRASPALHRQELSQRGFEWVDRHDAPQSIIAYLRRAGDEVLVVALNFTPVPRHDYRIGVPVSGDYQEVLNSDSAYYGGSNLGNLGDLRAEPVPWMGRPYSVSIVLPPLAGVVLRPAGARAAP
jgi:1,4-alpha-glucan branching enzyme